MNEPRLIEFDKIGDEEVGYISVAQYEKNIPFSIQRVYWVYNTPEEVQRGNHAHKTCQQVIVAVKGTLEVILENLEGRECVFRLDTPDKGLFIPEMHWRKINFSSDAICVCLASSRYDEVDYIRAYEDFQALKKTRT
ncbi:MAG TPA: FdtA/QdtA family cupin domain-containing protein [Cytophagaceae bacterium]